MEKNIIEDLRETVVTELFKMKSFKSCWNIWEKEIKSHIGTSLTTQSILGIGDHLSDVFSSTRKGGRNQSSLSGGGACWEAILVWYLNLCCVGTRVVAIKNIRNIPTPLRDAMSVNYSNFSCTTESDITVIVFPDESIFTSYNPEFYKRTGKINMDSLSNKVAEFFENFSLGIIQCKTNWNDNAQIPMLWDMIYAAGFPERQISVGRNNYSIQDLPNFTYSFVTVPTNKIDSYKITSLAVKRVMNLSGRNFWGRETKPGIANSVREIFTNYKGGFVGGDIKKSLVKELPKLSESYQYFRLSFSVNE